MSKLAWKYIKPLKDEKAVEDFLDCNNVRLPLEIIDCIKENNGGRPINEAFDTTVSKERVFKSLLSYNKSDKETIYACYSNVFKNKNLFPIASDPAGNFICVDLKNNNAIVFFELESSEKEFISDDFKELLDSLY